MNRASLIGHVLELFELIDKTVQPPDRLTSDFFRARKYLGSHDRRFISEPVFGMIRHRRFIEALLEHYIAKNPNAEDLDAPHNRYLPLFVAYAIAVKNHFEEKDREVSPILPDTFWKTYFPKHDLQSVAQWIDRHKALDFLEHDNIIQLGVRYSFQDWMVQEWCDQIGDETENLLCALNAPAPVTLRVNLHKAKREDCQNRLLQEGVETEPAHLSPSGLVVKKRFNIKSLQSFKDGWFEIQDEGSQAVSLIANPKPEDIVIDACAGAGGKALHMADLMKGQGEIIAIDVDGRRLSELQTRAERAGIDSVRVLHRKTIQPENFYSKADVVLVDAPCSGVGTIRRNPGFKWSVSESLVIHRSEERRVGKECRSRW